MSRPFHPIFVHFPIALLALSVAADGVAFFLKVESLSNTAWWSLLGAAAGGMVTVLTGIVDMRRAKLGAAVHARVHRHMKVGLTLITAIVGLTVWRATLFLQGIAVTAIYVDCGLIVMVLAGFQGWLGGELVYSYGVFVSGPRSRSRGEASNSPAKEEPNAGHHH